MKVVVDLSTFTKSHCGGKDEVAYNLLKGFSKLGYAENIIVIARDGVDEIVKSIDNTYKIERINRWINLSKPGLILSFFTDLFYGFKVKKLVKRSNASCLLYTNKFIPSIRVCEKTILIPHDIQCFRNLKELHKKSLFDLIQCWLLFWNLRVCDYIIAISDYDKQEMLKYLPKHGKKIKRVYDPIIFKSVEERMDKEYITALNVQWAHKNVITLIRAYAKIATKVHENLAIVGKTNFSMELQKEIDSVIEKSGIKDRIIFTGFVSDQELTDIIAKTRIYVNTSLFEGFGMTAVEMMGGGVPTIVNTDTALPESTMGLCRYYEPALNDEKLANVILEELEHPTSEEQLNNIAKKIKENYDYITISKEYLKLLGLVE